MYILNTYGVKPSFHLWLHTSKPGIWSCITQMRVTHLKSESGRLAITTSRSKVCPKVSDLWTGKKCINLKTFTMLESFMAGMCCIREGRDLWGEKRKYGTKHWINVCLKSKDVRLYSFEPCKMYITNGKHPHVTDNKISDNFTIRKTYKLSISKT